MAVLSLNVCSPDETLRTRTRTRIQQINRVTFHKQAGSRPSIYLSSVLLSEDLCFYRFPAHAAPLRASGPGARTFKLTGKAVHSL